MNEEIFKLLHILNWKYSEITDLWQKHNNYKKINLRNKIVEDITTDKTIFSTILNYREFIMENSIGFVDNIHLMSNDECWISARIKNRNSTEYKLNNYLTNKQEKGKMPLRKCFNDLLGVRIICRNEILTDEIKKYVKKEYPKFWCIDSTKKEGYIATHIYLCKDNFTFPWELQIWEEKFEKSNLESHAKYKQGYTIWENNNKGGAF